MSNVFVDRTRVVLSDQTLRPMCQQCLRNTVTKALSVVYDRKMKVPGLARIGPEVRATTGWGCAAGGDDLPGTHDCAKLE